MSVDTSTLFNACWCCFYCVQNGSLFISFFPYVCARSFHTFARDLSRVKRENLPYIMHNMNTSVFLYRVCITSSRLSRCPLPNSSFTVAGFTRSLTSWAATLLFQEASTNPLPLIQTLFVRQGTPINEGLVSVPK